jgi:putative membrane-bound dehydrogenase-like protein
VKRIIAILICICLINASAAWGQFDDKSADRESLPQVPAGFEVTVFASEPLVRQPCSMAFDPRGRLFVGMGPQYRNPTPETPGDSVVMFLDTTGDGRADTTKVFATGFNAIQGLAWHGRDLWIANAPDLTVVRDLDGDDEADEYIKIYTDLGNLEHGLHGLTWAPDGKLYMSKGNSKGLNQPGRYAPKPFRDLWGLTAPKTVPDFPEPVRTTKADYRRAFHDPADDWGLQGGVLRCDEGGRNLEIVTRGCRNPWDIALDGGFNWLGTDNDQVGGDRVIMPFYGAHFGWNHAWSSHWGTEPHAPTAPVSGPLFEGSGTGIIFGNSPQFPSEYRGVFFINDWLRKTTFVWRPQWDGALLRPADGDWMPFIVGGNALFRPTDLQFGPDGALWILGWSSGYGAEWKDGQLTNEGRIFRVAWRDAGPADLSHLSQPFEQRSIDELIDDFDSPLPVRRINAQQELVRRAGLGNDEQKSLVPTLLQQLTSGKLTENQETWTVWTLGRMPMAEAFADFLHGNLRTASTASLNLQIQSIRILARSGIHQKALKDEELGSVPQQGLQDALRSGLRQPEPRLRFAAVQAVHQTGDTELLPDLLDANHHESDSTVFYAGWQALRALQATQELREMLVDSRPAVRRAALLGLLETHAANPQDVRLLAEGDVDTEVRQVAELWLAKSGKNKPKIEGRSLQAASAGAAGQELSASSSPASADLATIRNLEVKNDTVYQVLTEGFRTGAAAYIDRSYRLSKVPAELVGADLIQTANDDDNSRGANWLRFDALVPVRVLVGIDARQKVIPGWLRKNFQPQPFTATIDEGAVFVFYEKTFAAGPIALGGNTHDGSAGGKGNYVVAIHPLPLEKQPTAVTVEAALAVLDQADPVRGELLFRHAQGAGCAKCHSIDQTSSGFGPHLGSIGLQANVQHIVQSIVQPSAVITQGFNQVNVLTDDGTVYAGVLLEESGLTVSLGQSNGERVDIPKSSIDDRKTSPASAMPEMAEYLTPQQVADLTAFLVTLQTPVTASAAGMKPAAAGVAVASSGLSVESQADRLRIKLDGNSIVDFVFRDDKILRPYFANAKLPSGRQVTRNHPPVPGADPLDHDTMHPGLWLGFGDLSSHDFWRNKGTIEHVRFLSEPRIESRRLTFATECHLKTASGEPLCTLHNNFMLISRPRGWLLVWTATFDADRGAIVFGDQEEMGFAARVATPLTEKNGGVIRNSTGKATAKETWGQPAQWCDYSGTAPDAGGILLMAGSANFRESWWHNRDYGVFVANPFGREAMQQGPRSAVTVAAGDTFRLTFGALIHDGQEFDVSVEQREFERLSRSRP